MRMDDSTNHIAASRKLTNHIIGSCKNCKSLNDELNDMKEAYRTRERNFRRELQDLRREYENNIMEIKRQMEEIYNEEFNAPSS